MASSVAKRLTLKKMLFNEKYRIANIGVHWTPSIKKSRKKRAKVRFLLRVSVVKLEPISDFGNPKETLKKWIKKI